MDAGQQFARIERLAQVIVSADLQPDNPVHVFALRRQHDDRRAVVGGTKPAADGKAIFARHHQVQNDQVGRFTQHQPRQCLAVFGQYHFEAPLG
jgi:mRNA degradation ribonuclease J1/J2